MNVCELIRKKRDGLELSSAEINYIINGVANDLIPDYQTAAWLMAVFLRGMNSVETTALTKAMVTSGEQLCLSAIPGIKVDKHSTGGVGDKTTLIVAPLVAACGVPVAKLSGRGLGHTGGTLDKLESFTGMRLDLNEAEFIDQVNSIGIAITGQTANLVPADKRLYALRDVTATVDSIPLIAASIMSKKLAAGADAFVLDVKAGRGAFMPDVPSARNLATVMIDIAQHQGKKAVALVTAMNSPLGCAVGNALEVKEAIAALNGNGPPDLMEVCIALAIEMLVLAKKATNATEARAIILAALHNGTALAKLASLVRAQGGDPAAVENPKLLPQAPICHKVTLDSSGYITKVDALTIGQATMQLGAGRNTKDDLVDLAVGVQLVHKEGAYVKSGDPVAIIHARNISSAEKASELVASAFHLAASLPATPLMILDRIATE